MKQFPARANAGTPFIFQRNPTSPVRRATSQLIDFSALYVGSTMCFRARTLSGLESLVHTLTKCYVCTLRRITLGVEFSFVCIVFITRANRRNY